MSKRYGATEIGDMVRVLLLSIFFPAAFISGCASTAVQPTASRTVSPAALTKFNQAVTEFKQAAEEGDPKAQASLCIIYYGGLSDYAGASLWCGKAADQGVPEAEYILGQLYDFGLGTRENNALSVQWYRRAAERGYDPAQADLGAQYFLGEGVPRDYAKMIPWYRKAAEQGHPLAQNAVGSSYFHPWYRPYLWLMF